MTHDYEKFLSYIQSKLEKMSCIAIDLKEILLRIVGLETRVIPPSYYTKVANLLKDVDLIIEIKLRVSDIMQRIYYAVRKQ